MQPTPNPNIHQRPYTLTEYDPSWPKIFEAYAKQVRNILGDNLIEIHHFGSTSIPGMFGKPNIDMYALVASFPQLREKIPQLKAAGFASRGDYSNIGEEYFTIDNPDGERVASLHIFEGDDGVLEDYRNFRDYLTQNNDAKNRYIALKRDLYARYRDDYPAYDAGKKQLIDQLKAEANAWAKQR